jgi:phage gp36-like protein
MGIVVSEIGTSVYRDFLDFEHFLAMGAIHVGVDQQGTFPSTRSKVVVETLDTLGTKLYVLR